MGNMKFPHASGNSTSIAAPGSNPASDIVIKLPSTLGSANQFLKNGSTPGELEFGSTGICTNNLVINGDMSIAQRGTSSTSNGYHTVDRWVIQDANTGQTATQSQVILDLGRKVFETMQELHWLRLALQMRLHMQT